MERDPPYPTGEYRKGELWRDLGLCEIPRAVCARRLNRSLSLCLSLSLSLGFCAIRAYLVWCRSGEGEGRGLLRGVIISFPLLILVLGSCYCGRDFDQYCRLPRLTPPLSLSLSLSLSPQHTPTTLATALTRKESTYPHPRRAVTGVPTHDGGSGPCHASPRACPGPHAGCGSCPGQERKPEGAVRPALARRQARGGHQHHRQYLATSKSNRLCWGFARLRVYNLQLRNIRRLSFSHGGVRVKGV